MLGEGEVQSRYSLGSAEGTGIYFASSHPRTHTAQSYTDCTSPLHMPVLYFCTFDREMIYQPDPPAQSRSRVAISHVDHPHHDRVPA